MQYALYIEHRFSVITRLLHEVLGVGLDIAKQDACGVEHVISNECYLAICSFLREQATVFISDHGKEELLPPSKELTLQDGRNYPSDTGGEIREKQLEPLRKSISDF